jgi:hypothetical protein
VVAEPSSVNVLEGYAGDPRTPDKLVDGMEGVQGLGREDPRIIIQG